MFPSNYIKALIEATRQGPVETWKERMRQIADEIGLDPASIDWDGSPSMAAYHLVDEAKRRSQLDSLRRRLGF